MTLPFFLLIIFFMKILFFNIILLVFYYTIEYIVEIFNPIITNSMNITYITINSIISLILSSIVMKLLKDYGFTD